MVKKKPTKKDIETVISNLIGHVRFIEEKLNALDSLFGLYLDWKKDNNKFNKFVESKVEEYQGQVSNSEPGETK